MMLTDDKREILTLPRRRSGRVALGLLIYAVLTLVVFELVWHYVPRVAARVGGIHNGWLKFGIYFLLYIGLIMVATTGARWITFGLRRETLLRICFLGGLTLSLAVAFYQARFGTGLSATYFTVGLLGTFVGSLLATLLDWPLVEVNAPPSPEIVRQVMRAHGGITIAHTPWDHAKRALDLLISLALILLSLPISVLLAMVIWLQDPGPLLVAKIAVTRGGRSFGQLKLRSMIKNAEQGTGAIPVALGDQRVTRVGQVLRRTHIDELPQLINIAWGDMSLVGPRPERTIFVARHIMVLPKYRLRHVVRPGLAGMAQVYGDYYSVPREKIRYDLLYIRRCSLGLDCKLFLTAMAMGLLGVWPGPQRGRKQFNACRQEERWRQAYEALHGGVAPQSPPQLTVLGSPDLHGTR